MAGIGEVNLKFFAETEVHTAYGTNGVWTSLTVAAGYHNLLEPNAHYIIVHNRHAIERLYFACYYTVQDDGNFNLRETLWLDPGEKVSMPINRRSDRAGVATFVGCMTTATDQNNVYAVTQLLAATS